MASAEAIVSEMGLDILDYSKQEHLVYKYGSMAPYRIVGNVLYLGGHVPDLADETPLYPGRLGAEVTIEQGYEAARVTALNCLATMRLALGSLDRVKCLVNSLNFVVAAPGFFEVNLVSSGATDLFRDIWGPEAGIGGRATIGVASLAHNHCFENWLQVEIQD
jgi:enamine deaminase RidA (YjgF/YER057c/UK114 family)